LNKEFLKSVDTNALKEWPCKFNTLLSEEYV
jgi:hypothetical protein